MNRVRIAILLVVLSAVMALTGCASQQASTALPATAMAHAYPPPMYDPEEVAASLTAIAEEEVVAAEPTESPQTEPTEVVEVEPDVDNCLECHTDQQTLVDTADPVAEVISENEGEG